MNTNIKNIHIFGGGTVEYIANHFAICAPAYGNTALQLRDIIAQDHRFSNFNAYAELTKMAGGKTMESNSDILNKINELKNDFNTKIIFFNCALVDFSPKNLNIYNNRTNRYHTDDPDDSMSDTEFGKYSRRLDTHSIGSLEISLKPSSKVISTIRKGRKDIFLVGFKTTCGASKQEMYIKGLKLCKNSSCNLVLVNDTKTRWNMIVAPEEAAYHETNDRSEALKQLVDMVFYRSHLTFTQSTVVDGSPVPWNDSRVPESLRTIVNHCIHGNAYKPFHNSTAGHFAVKLSDNEFLTSIRKSNFNNLEKNGLVYVKTSGPDTVIAYGAKPSVGGQSQRIVFNDHPGYDCIVHFHSPLKPNHRDKIKSVSQREVECGSHQCGKNTSNGLIEFFGPIKCVMLDNHGPNIVFNKNIDPNVVIDFIDANFDLSLKSGGYQFQNK